MFYKLPKVFVKVEIIEEIWNLMETLRKVLDKAKLLKFSIL